MPWKHINQAHIWQPCTQLKTAPTPVFIDRGEGALLYDTSGQSYVDAVSSWWVNTHGHSHPKIVKAITEQAAKLDHVLFAGFTHQPAIDCAQKLCEYLDPSLCKIFFSESGSSAIEIGLKMAFQYWHNLGQTNRTQFITFNGNYHGDTFGCMAVGKSSGFYEPFHKLLFNATVIDWPNTWPNDPDMIDKETAALAHLDQYLSSHGHETAGAIFEPILQGANGLRYCRPEFIAEVVRRCRAHDIVIVFDEVMTGFGRLGSLFAYELVGEVPDIICLAKGLTGGTLPLAATVANSKIFEAFYSDDFSSALFHSHSYTANPITSAAAAASLALFAEEKTLEKIAQINAWHHALLSKHINPRDGINVRIIGSIAAFDVPWVQNQYGSTFGVNFRQRCLERGVLIRPIGNVVYIMPPYCISHEQLSLTYEAIGTVLVTLRDIQDAPVSLDKAS